MTRGLMKFHELLEALEDHVTYTPVAIADFARRHNPDMTAKLYAEIKGELTRQSKCFGKCDQATGGWLGSTWKKSHEA